MKKFLILLLIVVGCNRISFKQKMESWLGHHKSELLRSWGPPAYTNSDGKGGEIITYSTNRNYYENNYFTGGVVQNQVSEYRDFYVDNTGNIYYVRWGRR